MHSTKPSTPHARSRRRRQGGFTLTEVLIAMTVMVFALAGLISMHRSGAQGNQSTTRVARGSVIGQRVMEDLRSMSVPTMISLWGPLPIDTTLATVESVNVVYTPRIVIEELPAISPDLLRMTVEVSWTDDGAAAGDENGRFDHLVSFELLRTRQEAL